MANQASFDGSEPMAFNGPKVEITTLHCARFIGELIEPIREVLSKHGVTLEVCDTVCILHFPVGTVKHQCYPITQASRYVITLPDSYQLHEYQSVRPNGYSAIYLDLHELPPWVQQKYGKSENTRNQGTK